MFVRFYRKSPLSITRIPQCESSTSSTARSSTLTAPIVSTETTIQDKHGQSQIVAAAITAYEGEASFAAIVSHLVSSNDISKTKALMIDKDLIESKVLKVSV